MNNGRGKMLVSLVKDSTISCKSNENIPKLPLKAIDSHKNTSEEICSPALLCENETINMQQKQTDGAEALVETPENIVPEQFSEIEYSITELTDDTVNSGNLPELLKNQPADNSIETYGEQSLSETNNNSNNPGPSTIITKRKSLRNKKQKTLAYMDYLSEDEIFMAEIYGSDDSDLWEGESDSSSSSCYERREKKQKRKKRIQETDNGEKESIVGELGNVVRKENKRKIKKKARQSGQEYIKSDGTLVPAKSIRPNPCTGKKCGNNYEIVTEEKRKHIFDHFWSLSSERRKDWIVGLTQKLPVKRKRSNESEKRQFTFKYFINEGEGRRAVCLQFLACPLDVSQKFIYYTISNASFGSAKEDMRGKSIPPNKTKETTKVAVHNFIKSLPAIPSHYARKDSNRVYLPQEFKNLSNLYQVYKKDHLAHGIDVVGERVFRNIFNADYNIGFHVPKKDKCLLCLRFERLDTTDEVMQQAKIKHLAEKEHSYNRFKAHQNIFKMDSGTLCVSFDLQKVLNTPKGESILLYYSRKLSVYNLTFYESCTRDVFCYYWDEVNGKRGANEVASILHTYIKMVDERESVTRLLLYCDCCPGQNRNRTSLAMIHATLQNCKFIETIQINFLLTGHTYMPVDSVHAVIEKNTKHSIIWAPSQWYTVFETARQHPRPYKVQYLTYKDFNKWDTLVHKYFKGNLAGKISKVRVCTFKKRDSKKIFIKNSMDKEETSVEIEVQSKVKVNPTGCYESPLPISKLKYNDLIKLCTNNVIPALFHNEYVNIPTASNVRDTLDETDIEDEDIPEDQNVYFFSMYY